jgi:hypothetical protein
LPEVNLNLYPASVMLLPVGNRSGGAGPIVLLAPGDRGVLGVFRAE